MKYSSGLCENHNDLPFCVEAMNSPNLKNKKLITNLNNKTKYIIHYRNLQQAMQYGLELTKIHRVLSFNQSTWMKSYINLNNNMRMKASSAFEKDYFKLMNNAAYGKTMENIDNRVDVKLITHWENIGKKRGAKYYISKPNFHSLSIFDENFVDIQMKKLKTIYNKPIYLGFCVLELSKYHMYDFHYSVIKVKYQDNVKLLYTDTDSFIYEFIVNDIYEDMKQNISLFDTSNYSPNKPYCIPLQNKAILGKFKDEMNGKLIFEFVGLRSKMYSILTEESEELRVLKNVL